ncbi:MAG: acyl-CoA thioesterase [Candidatus Omnitrophica bacterium]|nr:acyl-CoA thioesterase [Candidatus Omnitrophota bacterium]
MPINKNIEIRVRYAETDKMGFVYYSNYLVWFEMARTNYFRNAGFDYNVLEKERNIFLPVVECVCRYKRPLFYDDVISAEASIKEISKTSLVFEYKITKGNVLTTTGSTKHVFINSSGKTIPVPEDIRKVFLPA